MVVFPFLYEMSPGKFSEKRNAVSEKKKIPATIKIIPATMNNLPGDAFILSKLNDLQVQPECRTCFSFALPLENLAIKRMKKLPFLFLFISASLLHAQNYNLTLRSHVHVRAQTPDSNIWGYVDSTGREYALMGTSFGVSIVDVSNPDSPKVLFNVHTANSEWREIKTFQPLCVCNQ